MPLPVTPKAPEVPADDVSLSLLQEKNKNNEAITIVKVNFFISILFIEGKNIKYWNTKQNYPFIFLLIFISEELIPLNNGFDMKKLLL